MSKSSVIGKNHVLKVSQALKESLAGNSIELFPETIRQTVSFIQQQYPEIESVIGKYETDQPDANPDLALSLTNQQKVNVNLFLIRGRAAIQPKNLGAKSFLKKYFCSEGLQIYFNHFLKKEYEKFLRQIISRKENAAPYDQTLLLRRRVDKHYPKFHPDINPLRTDFLYNLREYCFEILKDEYNVGAKGIQHAFNELMMLKDTTIITRYTGKDKCLVVERWKSEIDGEKDIQIYKKGNDTVGIRSGNEALTLRFKFESNPTSSIKIATSYELFPEEETLVQENLQSIEQFEQLINRHVSSEDKKKKSNAIGKCNEAMIYYRILKENPTVNQVDEKEYRLMLTNSYTVISAIELAKIKKASIITVEKISHYLTEKYGDYEIEEIQLVADNYLKDRLDTSDIQLVLFVDQRYVIEAFSLKATARRNVNIGTKNPGAGTILGPTYFDIGSLDLLLEETKKRFRNNELNHRESQEIISAEVGRQLKAAPQEKIKRGVKALLGNHPMVVTIYMENDSLVLEYDAIRDEVEVYPQTPSTIQTTLRWNDQQEELSLRVKFSEGQKHGWSSLKLSCAHILKSK